MKLLVAVAALTFAPSLWAVTIFHPVGGNPMPLTTARSGIAYSEDVTAGGGVTPYTWQGSPSYVLSGALPPGLAASQMGNLLRISGTPTTTGTFVFTLGVEDSTTPTPVSDSANFQITVVPWPAPLPFLDEFTLPLGWQLSGPWERDTATSFTQASPACSEPGSDHSVSANNMILGDTIGNKYATNQGTVHWATSPLVDCSAASNVRLCFWCWLGLAAGSQASIEVTNNGSSWTNVWTSTAGTTYGGTTTPMWTSVFYDITSVAAGSATVQVRIGIGPTGATALTGWCIDDFLIEEPSADMEVRETGSTGAVVTDGQAVGGGRDFGTTFVSQQSPPLTIYISNYGPTPISFSPSMTKTGAQPTDFFINASAFQNPLPAGTSTSFTITFYRTAPGISTATINLFHNAAYSGTSPFEINVQGTAASGPQMSIDFGSTVVPDGSTLDIGSVPAGVASNRVFSVHNLGFTDLNLTGTPEVQVLSAVGCTATVSAPPGTTLVTPGATTTFELQIVPAGTGAWSFQISIDNNDPTQNPYDVLITGTGIGGGSNDDDDEEEPACSTGDGHRNSFPALIGLTFAALIWRAARRRRVALRKTHMEAAAGPSSNFLEPGGGH
jgi:hypothetical protein